MRISTLKYCLQQGIRNIFKNSISSLFSLIIMVTTIFIFSVSYAGLMNVNNMVERAQTSVGLTVFFNDGYTEEEIKTIGARIAAQNNVDHLIFTSSEEAWAKMKDLYFKGNEGLAEGFEEQNPLANSASYEIFLKDISRQQEFVSYLQNLEGVRRVNYSSVLASGMANINRVAAYVTLVVLIVLLGVSILLINNSISLSIAIRKEEIHIMRYIGATNGMIRLPFIIEGIVLGAVGAVIPVAVVYHFYDQVLLKLGEMLNMFSALVVFLPREEIFHALTPIALLLGIGIGLLGSIFSLHKHLKV